MITLIQIAVFIAAFLQNKKLLMLISAVASFFIPDEIPLIDEILMLAATTRSIVSK